MSAATDEMLDVLDDEGRPTGGVKSREQVHVDGDWHAAIHIWVVRPGQHVLLQRRGRRKDLEPLRLDVSVGGHLQAGETVLDATREAEEELGLLLRPGQLEYLGAFRCEREYQESLPPQVDREFREVYAVFDDSPLEQYLLDPLEVDTVYEVPLRSAIALFEHRTPVAAAGFDSLRRPSDALLYEGDLPSAGGPSLLEGLHALAAWLEERPLGDGLKTGHSAPTNETL